MRNWLRACTLSLTGGGGDGKILTGGGPTDLRVSFQIESHTLQSPDLAQFVIFNPSRQTAVKVQKEFTDLVFSAGYEGNTGEIFKGSIVETQYGEKIDNFTTTLLRIWCANSDLAYSNARVNTSLAAGSTPQTIVDTCLQSLGQFGVTMGQVAGIDLSQPRFPRGIVLAGMARDFLREVALSKGATHTLSNGRLSIVGKDASVPGGPIVLSPSTGMIGQPIQRPEGIIVECLINPAIQVNTNIQIKSDIVSPSINGSPVLPNLTDRQTQLQNQLDPNGNYRVLHSLINGDSRGDAWTMTLTTLGVSQQVNQTQAGLGYS